MGYETGFWALCFSHSASLGAVLGTCLHGAEHGVCRAAGGACGGQRAQGPILRAAAVLSAVLSSCSDGAQGCTVLSTAGLWESECRHGFVDCIRQKHSFIREVFSPAGTLVILTNSRNF